jgi:hypothetical protein
MVIVWGTFSRERAPVELMKIFSSIVIPGKGVTSLPVAMMIF